MKEKIPQLERAMRSLARFQCRFYIPIIIASLSITGLLLLGLPNVRIQSDFTKILPQDMPEIVFNNRISETFGSTDTVFVLVRLDRECTSCTGVQDIREPDIMRMLIDIQDTLQGETGVDSVFSVGSFFSSRDSVPASLEGVKLVLSQIPGSGSSFNRDYSATIVTISASVGGDQGDRNRFSQAIMDDLENVEKPPGILLTLTGSPQLESDIFMLLEKDAVNVTLIAGLLILGLLLILLRSPIRVLQTYTPVLFSLSWTLGVMGWLNIELSVATVAVGAFIIGLGIEYGIFFVKRFEEGLDEGMGPEGSTEAAVSGVGSAITSSATTTIIGFMMLTLTILPIIQILGITLSLSILFSLLAALVINPAFMIAEEKLGSALRKRRSA